MFKYCATFPENTVDEIKLMLGMYGLVSYQYSSILWYFETENEIGHLKPLKSGEFMRITTDDKEGQSARDLIEGIKKFANTIKHCGDYGELYINTGENSVFWVAGDADFDPDEVSAGVCSSEAYIINGFRELGIENITIEPEYGPDESDGWECLGKFGIDNWKEKKVLIAKGIEKAVANK